MDKRRQGHRETTQIKEVIRSLKALDNEIEKRVFQKERSGSSKEQRQQERDIDFDGNEF